MGGVIILKRKGVVRGSKWFGKMSTVVFYVCMLALVLSELFRFTFSPATRWWLVGVAGVCMLVAFAGYLRIFVLASREGKAVSDESEKG